MKTVTFTDGNGNFEKTIKCASFNEAIKIARNPLQFPIEIQDYSKMLIIISNRKGEVLYEIPEGLCQQK